MLAVSTGLVGCLMMVLVFAYVIMYGQAVFVEPNSFVSRLELTVFVIGVVANVAAALAVVRE